MSFLETRYSPKLGEADGSVGCLPSEGRTGLGRWLRVVQRAKDGLGEEFLAAANTAFDTIERFPDTFARVHGEVRRAVVSRFPYAVFYRIETKRVVIFTVLHTARDPKVWPQPRKVAR